MSKKSILEVKSVADRCRAGVVLAVTCGVSSTGDIDQIDRLWVIAGPLKNMFLSRLSRFFSVPKALDRSVLSSLGTSSFCRLMSL